MIPLGIGCLIASAITWAFLPGVSAVPSTVIAVVFFAIALGRKIAK